MIAEIVAIGAGLVSVISAKITNNLAKQKAQAELEMKIRSEALDFGQFIQEWDETHKEIVDLLADTEIDRFLLFRAWNGFAEPKWTTSVLQIREGKQAPINYIHFELDDDYRDKLKACEISKHNYFLTNNVPNEAAIKRVYDSEGVKASLWSHILDLSGPKKSKILIYCSLSTTTHNELSPKTILKAKALVNKLKMCALDFQNSQNVLQENSEEESMKTPWWIFWK